MSQLDPLTLAELPDEVLQAIFIKLDARSLVNIGATSRRFSAFSDDPALWKNSCQTEFRYWPNRQSYRHLLRDTDFHDWKNVYKSRHNISRKTRNTIDELVLDSQSRSDRIHTIVSNGYGAKDALLQAFNESSKSPDHLAQRYWSHAALGCLHRSRALEEWTKIKFGGTDGVNLTERCQTGLDMFILDEREDGDMDDIIDRLDSYVEAVRSAYPDINEQTPRTKAMTIASYLRQRKWIGMDPGREYHSLDNMFLGVALFSSHNNSIALITSVIYSYVARCFNLRAQPINYPNHVHVLVQPPIGTDLDGNTIPEEVRTTHTSSTPNVYIDPNNTNDTDSPNNLYMDPFNTTEPVPHSQLISQIRFLVRGSSSGILPSAYLSPATHRELLARSARNILSTQVINTDSLPTPISPESAIYAAFFIRVLFPSHPSTLQTHLTELTKHFLHHFDHDIHLFRTYVLPLTNGLPDNQTYHMLLQQLALNDAEAPTPKFRSQNPTVQFRVGQLFRHRRRHYLALIYGWDSTCDMPQHWITTNQVDRLPRGRDQPFYNVFVIEDRSTRYVAEENVVLLGPVAVGGNGETVILSDVLRWPVDIGKWMKRFEINDDGFGWRFTSNVQDQYPED